MLKLKLHLMWQGSDGILQDKCSGCIDGEDFGSQSMHVEHDWSSLNWLFNVTYFAVSTLLIGW
jgi:hypothetical protein